MIAGSPPSLVDRQPGTTARTMSAGTTFRQQKPFRQPFDEIFCTGLAIDRGLKHVLRGREQTMARVRGKRLRNNARIHPRLEQNLVDISIADTSHARLVHQY